MTFAELRRCTASLPSHVEEGERLVVTRRGGPIAEIAPVSSSGEMPAWQRPALRLAASAPGLAAATLGERIIRRQA